jgi:REP element-mobilizing transposase RayT
MPCYLFTFHAKGSWFHDHEWGYVHRTRGSRFPDSEMAANYRRRQRAPTIEFTEPIQRCLIDVAIDAAGHLDVVVHAVATEMSHVHVLVSWRHNRRWNSIRRSLRIALSGRLNERFGRREWFVEGSSRKRVADHEHFDHLMFRYLPKHNGVNWFREEDVARATARRTEARTAASP